jgi:hypothetical protein
MVALPDTWCQVVSAMRFSPLALVVSLFFSFASVAPAHAQSWLADQRAEARRAFERGVEAARAGRWRDARDEFQRSHKLVPSTVTLLNLAGSQVNNGELVAGYETYRSILAAPSDAKDHVPDIERVVGELETRIPTLRIVCVQSDPRQVVQLDGKTLATQDAAGRDIRVNPGTHHVVLSRPGQAVVQHDVTLGEGQTLALDLDQVCALCEASRVADEAQMRKVPPPVTVPALAPLPADDGSQVPRHRALIWSSLGVSVAGLGLLGVVGPLALKANDELASGCGATKSCSEHQVERADRLALAADIGLGVAVGAALVASVAWLTRGKASQKHVVVQPHAGLHHVGAAAGVSF